ncbi:MAG: hypothetical protein B0D92_06460 [Spirochaeta sp. LUC14_002_19_P3]|nr:MAG: hypothetical protein B0D92_06460 [Spirochaeta sp. LUC14_002_19_P3]
MKNYAKRAGFLVLICLSATLWGNDTELMLFQNQLRRSAFPDNAETRRLFKELIMAPVYPLDEAPFRLVRQRSNDQLVQFELRKGIEEWYLIFRSQRGEELQEKYPLWGRGTWVIKKDMYTGEFVQAKVFIQDSEESFVRIYPYTGNRSKLDVHLFGSQIGDDVILPIAFEKIILSSFASIVAATNHSINWDLVFPNPDRIGYRFVENFVNQIKIYSSQIAEVEDGAIDSSGINVFIENGQPLPESAVEPGLTGLNCSGYVKWIADGVFSAWSGTPGRKYLDIEQLKEPTSRANRNAWSEAFSGTDTAYREKNALIRDPRFGLDWTRNLAWQTETARLGITLSDKEKSQLNTGVLHGIPYRADLGYPLENIPAVLHQLAAVNPGTVYLAAVNSRYQPDFHPSRTLALHQYWHVLVLAPWFAQDGSFHIAVLDTGMADESLLRLPGIPDEPLFPRRIMDKAIEYAKLGKDEEGNPILPEVMLHLVKMKLPPDFHPLPLH